jgi:hypothetical protein
MVQVIAPNEPSNEADNDGIPHHDVPSSKPLSKAN